MINEALNNYRSVAVIDGIIHPLKEYENACK